MDFVDCASTSIDPLDNWLAQQHQTRFLFCLSFQSTSHAMFPLFSKCAICHKTIIIAIFPQIKLLSFICTHACISTCYRHCGVPFEIEIFFQFKIENRIPKKTSLSSIQISSLFFHLFLEWITQKNFVSRSTISKLQSYLLSEPKSVCNNLRRTRSFHTLINPGLSSIYIMCIHLNRASYTIYLFSHTENGRLLIMLFYDYVYGKNSIMF